MQFHHGEEVLLSYRRRGKPDRQKVVFVKEETYRMHLVDGEELAMCAVRIQSTEVTVECSNLFPNLHLVR